MHNKRSLIIISIALGLMILACGTVSIAPTAPNRPSPTNPPPPTSAPEPTAVPVINTLEPVVVPGTELRQWAIDAFASSEYSNPSWAAIQAIGAPDTYECGDMRTAWAAGTSFSVEWLELTYAVPVIPTQINIYQTYNPDFVTKVEILDIAGNYREVYSAAGATVSDCPYVLSFPVTNVNEYVYGLRLTIDQTNSPSWNEIDAVELVGQVDSSAQVSIPPTNTPLPFVAGECEGGSVPILMNSETEQSVLAGTYPDSCEFYCLWVPENGRRLDIGISDFDVDLDLYVDTNISVLAFEDHGQWESNDYGDGDESISIDNPGGRYYIQVCSYEGLASTFTLYNLFVP